MDLLFRRCFTRSAVFLSVLFLSIILVANTAFAGSPNVKVQGAFDDEEIIAGTTGILRVNVENKGSCCSNSTAEDTELTVTLPYDLRPVSDDYDCSYSDNGSAWEVFCFLGDIPVFGNDERDVTIVVKAEPWAVADTADGIESAEVDFYVYEDEDGDEDQSSAQVFITELTDISVKKYANPSTGLVAGDNFKYYISVVNHGPSWARDVVVTDELIASGDVTLTGCGASYFGSILGCNFATDTGVFHLGDFQGFITGVGNPFIPGVIPTADPENEIFGRALFTLEMTANTAADLINTTYVETATPESDTANNNADNALSIGESIDPADLFDLSVEIVPNKTEIIAGETVQYTVTVTNNNADSVPAEDVQVFVTLPLNVEYQHDSFFCFNTGPLVYCPFTGIIDLLPGESREILISGRARANTHADPALGELPVIGSGSGDGVARADAIALAFSSVPEDDFENNIDLVGAMITEEADLTVTKVVSPSTNVRAGDTFTYTLFVDNFGPSWARDVVIVDTLVASGLVEVVSCSAERYGVVVDCTSDTFSGVFDLTFGANDGDAPFGDGALASYNSSDNPWIIGRAQFTIELTALEALDIENFVTVSSETPDPNINNNQTLVSLNVGAASDVEVALAASGAVAQLGDAVAYSVTVSNNGPSPSENVEVSHIVPGGQTVNDVSVDGVGTCTRGQEITCSLGTMASGDSVKINVSTTVTTDPSANTFVGSSAFANGDTFDSNMANNRANLGVEVLSMSLATANLRGVLQKLKRQLKKHNSFRKKLRRKRGKRLKNRQKKLEALILANMSTANSLIASTTGLIINGGNLQINAFAAQMTASIDKLVNRGGRNLRLGRARRSVVRTLKALG